MAQYDLQMADAGDLFQRVTPAVARTALGAAAQATAVTVTTARTTATKVGTTVSGTYTPTLGDIIHVTFTLGTSVATATLNIDGSGAKNIQLAGVNVTTALLSTPAASVVIPMYYDGTAWQIYGSSLNTDTNTTYIESTTGTAVTGTTQTCAVNNLDYANNATSVAFTLPATCALNQVVEIIGLNATGGFTITAPSGDNILINGNDTGSAGVVTGAVKSSIKLRCIVANTTWIATDFTGTITTNTGYAISTPTSVETLTNKTLTSPTLVTPVLGVASATRVTVPSVKGTLTTDTDGATITFDKNVSDFHNVVMAGNRILALSNMAVGDRIVLRLTQDATGSRIPTWFTTIKWAGGTAPTLTTTANKADMFGFICTSSGNYDGFVIGQSI